MVNTTANGLSAFLQSAGDLLDGQRPTQLAVRQQDVFLVQKQRILATVVGRYGATIGEFKVSVECAWLSH